MSSQTTEQMGESLDEAMTSTVPKRYVQYGCGLCAPVGFLNFDASPRLRFERMPGVSAVVGILGKRLFPLNVSYGDIVVGLPLADGYADAVFASHVLEHLSRDDVTRALANTFRLLKSGGVFRMIVPDLEWRASRYIQAKQSQGSPCSADDFMISCNMGEMDRAEGVLALLRSVFGNAAHRWMYDFALMSRLLEDVGFVDIRRCDFRDSGDPMFDKVEDRSRFYDSGEAELAIQARKP